MSPKRKPKLRPKIKIKAPQPSFREGLETMDELEKYIRSEGFNVFFGRSRGIEGDMIWCEGGEYCYGYSERGSLSVIESSADERAFVRAVVNRLGKTDKLARMEIVAWTWNEQDILSAAQELISMGVGFERNDIPDFDGRYAYRIFAYSKDKVKIPSAFYSKYMNR